MHLNYFPHLFPVTAVQKLLHSVKGLTVMVIYRLPCFCVVASRRNLSVVRQLSVHSANYIVLGRQ